MLTVLAALVSSGANMGAYRAGLEVGLSVVLIAFAAYVVVGFIRKAMSVIR